MLSEENKAVVRRFWQAFEANDQAALDDVLAPDFVAHSPSSPEPQNRETHLQGVRMFNTSFSDRQFVVEDMVVDGDKVATRTTLRGIHTGALQGFAPTGKPMSATGLTIEQVKDGKIVSRWFSFDAGRVMKELGLVPTPAEG